MIRPRVLVIDDDYGDSQTNLDEVQSDLVGKFDPPGLCQFAFCSGQVDGKNSLPKVLEAVESGWPPVPSRRGENWALVLLDVAFYQNPEGRNDDKWGFEVLAALRERWSDLPVVMLTREDEAKKRTRSNWGQADGFLPKPTEQDTDSEWAFLRRLYAFGLFPDLREGTRLAGSSPALLKVLQEARRFACDPLGSGRILYGETGTGKTELARFIHEEMRLLVGRKGKEGFFSWSASGANEDITKAALFGHWPGAYTDAKGAEPGLIERAHGGTFFLDEVASLGAGSQALFMESRRRDAQLRRLISRMGKFPTGAKLRQEAEWSIVPQPWKDHLQPDHRIAVDVVMLTASNLNLHDEEVADELGFRRDLLNDLGAPLFIPGLNDHREDIPEIFEQIVGQIVGHLGRPAKHVDDRVLLELQSRDWTKKNVVALRQIAEHAVIASRDFDEILVRHLPQLGPLPKWPGDRPTKAAGTTLDAGAAPALPKPNESVPTLADLSKVIEALEIPSDPALLDGVLPRLQDAYARLVLKLFGAALRATRDRRGETSSLRAVCKLLDAQNLKSRPESYAAYDIVLRILSLCDVKLEGLTAEHCELLSDDPDVKERVQQAIDQRRRPRR